VVISVIVIVGMVLNIELVGDCWVY